MTDNVFPFCSVYKMNDEDEYGFLEEACRWSDSQDKLLRNMGFVGDTVQPEDEEHQSAVAGEGNVDSAEIVMVTLPDENNPNDMFHTLPEESAVCEPNMEFGECVLNRSPEWDIEIMDVDEWCFGCEEGGKAVDLSKDSDLGFIELEMVMAQGPERTAKTPVDGSAECERDKVEVSGRELQLVDGLGALPNNAVRVLEQSTDPAVTCKVSVAIDFMGKAVANVGCGSGPQGGVQVFELGISSDNLKNVCGESSGKEDFDSVENRGTVGVRQNVGTSSEVEKLKEFEAAKGYENEGIVEVDELCRNRKQNESAEKVSVKNFERALMAGDFQTWDSLPIPVQECLENISKNMNSTRDGSGRYEEKAPRFLDLLKMVQEYNDKDDLEDVSLLDILRSRGVTFPRPRWWPDTALFNKSELVPTRKKRKK